MHRLKNGDPRIDRETDSPPVVCGVKRCVRQDRERERETPRRVSAARKYNAVVTISLGTSGAIRPEKLADRALLERAKTGVPKFIGRG